MYMAGSSTVQANLSSKTALIDIPLYNLKKPKEKEEAWANLCFDN
jgi:hypothetical protein